MKPVFKIQKLCQSQVGSSAAEFAIVLPLLLFFLLGIIDVGRVMWLLNSTEKATQMGVRMAVVTDMIPGGLSSTDYGSTLGQGASVASAFGAARCQKSGGAVSCSCTTTPCPTLTPVNSNAFDAIVQRMDAMLPLITGDDVTIDYKNSGLGYAGDPNGADIAPIVTVTVTNLSFTPLVGQFFGASFALPPISASLTLEDGSGTAAN